MPASACLLGFAAGTALADKFPPAPCKRNLTACEFIVAGAGATFYKAPSVDKYRAEAGPAERHYGNPGDLARPDLEWIRAYLPINKPDGWQTEEVWVRRQEVIPYAEFAPVSRCWPIRWITVEVGDYYAKFTFTGTGRATIRQEKSDKAQVYFARDTFVVRKTEGKYKGATELIGIVDPRSGDLRRETVLGLEEFRPMEKERLAACTRFPS